MRSCITGPVFDGAETGVGLNRPARDLSVQIGSLTLPNPLIAASGCFGYGLEYEQVVDLSSLGGVCVEGPVHEGARRAMRRRASSKRRPA